MKVVIIGAQWGDEGKKRLIVTLQTGSCKK